MPAAAYPRRRRSRVLPRFALALAFYIGVYAFFGSVHDFPQLRLQMNKVRMHDQIATQRQWITFFYFINEAGSGIKFLITQNPRYLYHFPSPSHYAPPDAAPAAQRQQGQEKKPAGESGECAAKYDKTPAGNLI